MSSHTPRTVAVRGPRDRVRDALRLIDAEPDLVGRVYDPADLEDRPWAIIDLHDTPDLTVRHSETAVIGCLGPATAPPLSPDGKSGPELLSGAASSDSVAAVIAVGGLLDIFRRVKAAHVLVDSGGWRPATAAPALLESAVAVWGTGPEARAASHAIRVFGARVVDGARAAEADAHVVLPDGARSWAVAGQPQPAVEFGPITDDFRRRTGAGFSPAALRRLIAGLADRAAVPMR